MRPTTQGDDRPELAEFDNVHQDDDGLWHATHTSGEAISGESWPELEAMAVAIRVASSWTKSRDAGWSV
ncbi:hypothetical protein ABGB17_20300 [Sphaerisporangium sp. B11E5]|uniref:hypothetical protein n=1 Tax=Sphaerisporangium sp. B11E5 TaxID=3153563 RepID=UPI00325CA37E